MANLYLSNKIKFELGKAGIDFTSDTFKVALMDILFVFDPDTHGTFADVSASEIASTGAYVAGTLTVETAWNQDNDNDRAYLEWNNYTFSAVGANMETFGSAIVYDDTHADKVIVGCIDFDTDIAVSDGNSFQLQDLGYDES